MTTTTPTPTCDRTAEVEAMLAEHGDIGRCLDAEMARQHEIEQEARSVNARIGALMDRAFALSARIERAARSLP